MSNNCCYNLYQRREVSVQFGFEQLVLYYVLYQRREVSVGYKLQLDLRLNVSVHVQFGVKQLVLTYIIAHVDQC